MSLPLNNTAQRNKIVSEMQKGSFWKPCPGTTKGYLCCGYQILTPMTGCGMYCRFCILQSYLSAEHQVVFENFDDLEREVREKMETRAGIVRFGTGEFADSLYSEHRTGVCARIASLLDEFENVVVEFKTKSDNIAPLREIKNPRKIIIGFSINTPGMIALHEENTASLQNRLRAAAECIKQGFHVAFHFDPIIHYPEWETDYREVVQRVFDIIPDPAAIVWWSLGGFRTVPALKTLLHENNCDLPLFSGEMILGEDKKLRYFRPIRVGFYRAIQEEVRKFAPDVPLYLCMESPEVWSSSGMSWRIPRGLPAYLDEQARSMLSRG